MENTPRQTKINKVVKNRQEGVIVLEDIHDPYNAAAVWRSCEAFGFQKVNIIFEQEKEFDPKRLGKATSASANKWLDFKIFKSTKTCIDELKKDGYGIYATVLDKEANNLQSIDFKRKKIAVIFGNEHRGLSETAINMADEKIYIPMKGMVQSLNLSVTAAIVMYEINRQRKNGNYQLSIEEKADLIKRFSTRVK